MEIQNFNANGQKIFIDPDWITGKTCLFTIIDRTDYLKGMIGLTAIRKEFIQKLESEGFIITTDKKDQDPNTIHLVMNDDTFHSGNDVPNFKKLFDQRMFELGGEYLNYPYSLSIEEYFKTPFFPAVFKNEFTNGGKDKFLIENEEQVEVIKKFYEKYKNKLNYKIEFDCSIFQQVIETPTENKTYMRVLMSASGDVLGASLKYSKVREEKREPRGLFEHHFWNHNSEFYLPCNGMFNYYSGGGDINLGQSKFDYTERQILIEHGIDPENPLVPAEVLEVAQNIATKGNKELGIMCGIDFIMDKKDGKWYYLEIQAFPAITEWAIPRRIRIKDVKTINDYIKLNAQDLLARHESLMLLMNKKMNLGIDTGITYQKRKPE